MTMTVRMEWTLYTLAVPAGELVALACEHLNLCAGAGCSCVTGGDGPAVCQSWETPTGRIATAEGPDWISVAIRGDRVTVLDVFCSERAPSEWRGLHVALQGYGAAVFQAMPGPDL